MQIHVQSFLNSATYIAVTVTSSTTISQLKTAIHDLTGVSTSIMELFSSGVLLLDAKNIGFYSITDGSYIASSNTISTLSTKEAKQLAKLELAQLRRKAGGDNTKPYYRTHNTYDIDLLADKYVGNTPAHVNSTLASHRPWL